MDRYIYRDIYLERITYITYTYTYIIYNIYIYICIYNEIRHHITYALYIYIYIYKYECRHLMTLFEVIERQIVFNVVKW